MKQVYIIYRMADDKVIVYGFLTEGRGSSLPYGASWVNDGSGTWLRPPSDANIEYVRDTHIAAIIADKSRGFTGPIVSYELTDKPLFPAETQDDMDNRRFRDACRHDGAKCYHDMPQARDIRRNQIRRQRDQVMPDLDVKFMRALGNGKKDEQDAAEAERQKWRDAPADPRIEAAASVEELKQIKVG
jgi:hypothetical protein